MEENTNKAQSAQRQVSARSYRLLVVVLMLLVVNITIYSANAVPVSAETLDTREVQMPVAEKRGILLQTRYGNLYYPEEFAEAVMVVLTETEDSTMVTVTTILAEKEVMLYTLILTEMELDGMEDFVFGYLQDEILGTISIVLQMEEQIPAEWSEDEFTRICELQETVNELLLQLQEDSRFEPGAAPQRLMRGRKGVYRA